MKQLGFAIHLAAFYSILAAADASAETLWIQVKSSQLRSAPEFFASTVGSVAYGDAVEKISERDGWAQVTAKGRSGYLPVSVVSEQRVVFSNRSATKVAADASDVVLAGKGFSKEVEERYKGTDSTLRFDLVDTVERSANADRKDVAKFVKAGGLKG